MTNRISVEVWSDFTCPFCYLGKTYLEKGIEMSDFAGQVDVTFRSFELDPTTPEVSDTPIEEALAKKYGKSAEEMRNMMEGVKEQAAEVGLVYDIDNMTPTNTNKAHRLAKYAEERGKGDEMIDRTLRGYFTDAESIGQTDVLVRYAEEVGLDGEEVRKVLEGDDYGDAVVQDIMMTRQIGIQGAPYFLFNRKYAVPGALPPEVFAQAIAQVAEKEGITLEEKVESLDLGAKGGTCGPEGCDL